MDALCVNKQRLEDKLRIKSHSSTHEVDTFAQDDSVVTAIEDPTGAQWLLRVAR